MISLFRYWSQKRMELFAKVENCGPFHMFFTLSCGDSRYPENFTAFLQDNEIEWRVIDGERTCFINGITLDEFMKQNSSKHEFIRNNILTATRHFNHRVKTFLKTVIKHKCSPMPVKHYSYRVEFQSRGSAHIHGVLWLDIKEIADTAVKNGDDRFRYLVAAMETVSQENVPNANEMAALKAYIDKFVTCSLRHPETKAIAEEVNCHHHTKTCSKNGCSCRFHFPRFPSLETIISIPLRLANFMNDDEKREMKVKMRTALGNVREALNDKEKMEVVNSVDQKEIKKLIEERDYVKRSSEILEDMVYVKKVLSYPNEREAQDMNSYLQTLENFSHQFTSDDNQEEMNSFSSQEANNSQEVTFSCHLCNKTFDLRIKLRVHEKMRRCKKIASGKILLDNLKLFLKEHKTIVAKLEENEDEWSRNRLLELLTNVDDLMEILDIDEKLPLEERNNQLIVKYHELLRYSTKGFSVVLQRDVNETLINNFNHEWLQIWDSNLDISPVFDPYAIITYICDYFMKVKIE